MREGYGLMFFEPDIKDFERTLSEWCARHVAKLGRRPNTLYANCETATKLPSYVYVRVGRSRYRINIRASESMPHHHWLLIREKGGETNEARASLEATQDTARR